MTERYSLPRRGRPLVAFFDHADSFEDFYTHYGVSHQSFASEWHGSGNHAFVRLIQGSIADVIWYEFSLSPTIRAAVHSWCGCRVRFVSTSWLHQAMWHTFYLSRHAWRLQPFKSLYAFLASYSASLSLDFFINLIRDRADILFCQDYSNGRFDLLIVLARLLGIRVVAYHAGSSPERYIGKLFKRFTIKRADRILASSRREAEMLVARFGVARERISVLLTPIDTEAFRPIDRAEACKIAKLEQEHRYILYVGRLDDRVKRISMLIDCFGRVAGRFEQAVLLIAGDGNDRKLLEGRARKLPSGKVRFLGWRSGAEQLAPLYALADCLVLVSRSEGFPTVVGEAMACGTPVIATDVGGVSELVADGSNGWLLEPESDEAIAESLAAALAEALSIGEETVAMRRHARSSALNQVSHAAVCGQLKSLLESER
ncbi:MAG: hypothetical protein RLZZ555_141 [Pseudomonadota bacterium]